MTGGANEDRSVWKLFLIFLRLGLTSFGGPIAHLGYFRNEFVTRRHWLSERSYVDLVALCQFLPGPASSQVGMAIGLSRCGYPGALAAWLGFTLPSAVALILFARGIAVYGDWIPAGVLHGFKVVAVAVVAQAVWGMGRSLCTDAARVGIMVAAAGIVLVLQGAWSQVAVIAAAGILGAVLFRTGADEETEMLPVPVGRRGGSLWLALFVVLLAGLPWLARLQPVGGLPMIDAFFRSGSLVFGGGHVVLPLLQAEVVATGWVDKEVFLAGYGAAQAVPGPLFSFASFLGASMKAGPSGWVGGFLCLVAVFTPSFLLIAGALPFWEGLRRNRRARAALAGINAAVVGLLLAAFYNPVWTSAIHRPADLILALAAWAALVPGKLPSWLVVIATAAIAGLLPLIR